MSIDFTIQASPDDSCLTIMASRFNDADECGRQAEHACQSVGCEAPLCRVHAEQCPICGAWLCEGCAWIHEREAAHTLVERVTANLQAMDRVSAAVSFPDSPRVKD